MSSKTIPCQRALFDIPDDVAYFNTAYMSPLAHSVANAGAKGIAVKKQPWTMTIPDFFDPVEKARDLFAKLIDADTDGVAFIPSISYGTAIAAANIPVAKGQKIIALKDQFPSNIYPWRDLCDKTGATLELVVKNTDGALTEAVIDAIDENTAIAALPNILWTDGTLLDLVAIGKHCRTMGAALVLDITQSCGAMEISMQDVQPDFMCVGTYKWMLGPYSMGFMYVAPKWRGGTPLEQSWKNRANCKDFANLIDYTDDYMPGARRFDVGQKGNFALMPAVVASLELLHTWGVANIAATLKANNRIMAEKLASIGLHATPEHLRASHYLGIEVPKNAPDDLLAQCAANKVYISQRGSTLRFTGHLWNTPDDQDKTVDTLRNIL